MKDHLPARDNNLLFNNARRTCAYTCAPTYVRSCCTGPNHEASCPRDPDVSDESQSPAWHETAHRIQAIRLCPRYGDDKFEFTVPAYRSNDSGCMRSESYALAAESP